MSRVLTVFRNSIAICNIESHIHVNGTSHKVGDVSFVDDVTVLVIEDAGNIIDKVCAVTAIAVNTFAGFGMDLNFSAGNQNVCLPSVVRGRAKQSKICTKRVML